MRLKYFYMFAFLMLSFVDFAQNDIDDVATHDVAYHEHDGAVTSGNHDDVNAGNKDHTDSIVHNDFESVRAAKIEELSSKFQSELAFAQESLIAQVVAKVDQIAVYSKKDKQNFLDSLGNAMHMFASNVHLASQKVQREYWSFLDDHGFSKYDPNSIDAISIECLNGFSKVEKNIRSMAREEIIKIANQAAQEQVEEQIKLDIEYSRALSEQAYQESLQKSLNYVKPSLWSSFCSGFKDMMKRDFKKALYKGIAYQVQNYVIYKALGRRDPLLVWWTMNTVKFINRCAQNSINYSDFMQNLGVDKDKFIKGIRSIYPVHVPEASVMVQGTNKISQAEQTFLKNRTLAVQKVLSDSFEIEKPLKIAFCCGGGGVRAMIGTLGLLSAAAQNKVLQASTYIAGVSGSAWLIAAWSYAHLHNVATSDYVATLAQMRSNLKQMLIDPSKNIDEKGKKNKKKPTAINSYGPAMLSGNTASEFAKQLVERYVYGQSATFVDFYGALIGNFSLGMVVRNKLQACWSTIAPAVQMGSFPLPLCANAIDAGYKMHNSRLNYEYLESSPFEVGSPITGYIPTQYFGSKFNNGALQTGEGQLAPEYPLHYFFGLYGSCNNINLQQIAASKDLGSAVFRVEKESVLIPVNNWLKQIVLQKPNVAGVDKMKYSSASVANFSKNFSTSLLRDKETVDVIDAEIGINVPLPTLLDRSGRNVDVIFVYDTKVGGSVEMLKTIAAYFDNATAPRKNKVAIPDCSAVLSKDLTAATMKVFNDPRITVVSAVEKSKHAKSIAVYNPALPTIIYIPMRSSMPLPDGSSFTMDSSKAPYSTSNFWYTDEQIDNLANAVGEAFSSQINDIVEIMQLVAKARYTV